MKTLIAANLDRLLEAKGFSYAELSRISRVSKGHLSDIRHGNVSAPSVWTLKRIADALGCKVDDLITTNRQDHIVNTNKKVYSEKQVKAIALTFFEAFPKHDSLHMESIFYAWFEKYGSKL